ncbi:MAG: hypothetical protein ABI670_00345 [Chloroflexota bacterium]
MEWLVNVHSVWRWVVLLLALGAIVLALLSAYGGRPWDSLSDRLSLFFTISMDIQLLIGAAVWVTESRWTGDVVLAWIHPLAMIVAVALAHIGRSRSDRASGDANKGRQAALFFIVSLLVVLIAIPLGSWPI